MHQDFVIVGAGIAGLYAGMLLRERYPNAHIAVLEQASEVGGRALTTTFEGIKELPCGAGIGRLKKDKTIISVMHKLGIPINTFKSKPNYSSTFPTPPHQISKELRSFIAQLRKNLRHPEHTRITFKDYATGILGAENYAKLTQYLGYTDYEQADAYETVKYYGLEDNYKPLEGFYVPWRALCQKMAKYIGSRAIHLNTQVLEIDPTTQIIVTNQGIYQAKSAIILAIPAAPLRQLLPSPQFPVYNHIQAQPFLRVYAHFAEESNGAMQTAFANGSIIMPKQTHLQKIYPIRPQKGIYMIAYADNAHAIYHASHLADTAANREYWAARVQAALGLPPLPTPLYIDSIHVCKWDEGTHYYPPLPSEFSSRKQFVQRAQRPIPSHPIFVVGEAVSRDQGWTHGSFDSVDKVIKKLNLSKS